MTVCDLDAVTRSRQTAESEAFLITLYSINQQLDSSVLIKQLKTDASVVKKQQKEKSLDAYSEQRDGQTDRDCVLWIN